MSKDLNSISNSWETPKWLFDELNEQYGPFDIDLCANRENSKCSLYCLDYFTDEIGSLDFPGLNDGNFRTINFKAITINSAFMNPPYSNPKPFIQKAWEDSKYCKIVCLIKCDPSTSMWQTFYDFDSPCPYCVDYNFYIDDQDRMDYDDGIKMILCPYCKDTNKYTGPKLGCEVVLINKRIKFVLPKDHYFSCKLCKRTGDEYFGDPEITFKDCRKCKGTGRVRPPGPSFPSALVIMDRRGLA